jgi:hypothetical protein
LRQRPRWMYRHATRTGRAVYARPPLSDRRLPRPESFAHAVAKLTDSRRQSCVQTTNPGNVPSAGVENPLRPGAVVLVTLGNPREKFWGAILALTAQGLSLSGLELGSFEDLISMIKAGDPAMFGVVFFPIHRIERVDLDSPDGSIPSLSQRFTEKTGLDPASVLTRNLTVDCPSDGDPR